MVQDENGTVVVEEDGIPMPAALPILRVIATKLCVSPLNGNGNPFNTRQLGAAIIAASGQPTG